MLDARHVVTNPSGHRPLTTPIGIAIHHSVSGQNLGLDSTEAEEIEHVRVIDAYHVKQGFGGFGYHVAAFPSGRTYLCGNLDGQRAHVAKRNHELIGIVAVGDFSNQKPSATHLSGLVAAIQAVEAHRGALPIDGHSRWALPGEGTYCPGVLVDYNWQQILEENSQPPKPDPYAEYSLEQLATAFSYAFVQYRERRLGDLHPFDRELLRRIAGLADGEAGAPPSG